MPEDNFYRTKASALETRVDMHMKYIRELEHEVRMLRASLGALINHAPDVHDEKGRRLYTFRREHVEDLLTESRERIKNLDKTEVQSVMKLPS